MNFENEIWVSLNFFSVKYINEFKNIKQFLKILICDDNIKI